MKQTFTGLWHKPWGKALIATLYSGATILAYFALAQIAFALWGSTWLPSISRPPVQKQVSATDSTEMQRLTEFHPYTGPGSPYYSANQPAQPAPQQSSVQQVTPVGQALPAPDTSGLGPPPISEQSH